MAKEGTRRGPYGKRHYTNDTTSDGESHETVIRKLRNNLLERRNADQDDSEIPQRQPSKPMVRFKSHPSHFLLARVCSSLEPKTR